MEAPNVKAPEKDKISQQSMVQRISREDQSRDVGETGEDGENT